MENKDTIRASESRKEIVTAVIPAFNEEKTIADLIKRCKSHVDKILVVLALRSSDDTERIARSLGVDILRDRGKGKGDGMRCAIDHINKGIIVFMDADGSHIPEDIPKLVAPIREGRADMVIGSRFLGGSEELHGDFNKFLRMFFSMCIAQIMNWRFRVAMQDTQNGFRAIKVDIAKQLGLISKHTEIETEMDVKCLKSEYRIVEVPSMELKRKYGKSNIKLSKHGWRFAWALFRNLF